MRCSLPAIRRAMVDMSKARIITLSIVANIPISVVGSVLYFSSSND